MCPPQWFRKIQYTSGQITSIYAFNESSGDIIWRKNLNGTITSSPAVHGNLVFAYENEHGNLYAIDRLSSQVIWSRFINSSWSSPTVANGKVFIGTFNNGTFALNETNGDLLWKTEPVYDTGSTPAYFDGKIYVGVGGYVVYSFNEVDGSINWTFSAPAGFSGSPAITDDYLITGCWNGNIYILKRTTGAVVWNYTTGLEIRTSPAVAGGKIYLGSHDNKLYCIQAGPIYIDVTWGKGIGPYCVAISCDDIVTSFNMCKVTRKVCFNINADSAGTCNITMPRIRIDDPFQAIIDEVHVAYTLEENPDNCTLSFTYVLGNHSVEIIGTEQGYMIGDINGDGRVDMKDIGTTAKNFGHKESDYPSLPDLFLFLPEVNGLDVSVNGVVFPGSRDVSIVRIDWNWGDV